MKRVGITGLGVVAPNGVGLAAFRDALRHGRSGLRLEPRLAELNFGCHVLGVPPAADGIGADVLTPQQWRATNSAMRFAAAAAVECWRDAGFEWNCGEEGRVDWDTAVCFGTDTPRFSLFTRRSPRAATSTMSGSCGSTRIAEMPWWSSSPICRQDAPA
ncbi:MAG TPA: beta-ketoacyl synthase N-terminal-like domain-containing protein, partial [Bryobacteraceae bacterium]|nr:beta-ketoacyl synthase N-terminal-like domain-containing protein [Bryobacteraceae bacterium]